MNRTRLAACLLLAAATLASPGCVSVQVENPPGKEPGAEKVFVCHKGKTLEIARPALDAHLKHGDAQGACP